MKPERLNLMEIRDLGLAAYLKMNGVRLLNVREGNVFVFEGGSKSAKEWELEYVNSCCFKHDRELMSLRKLMSRE